VQSFDYSQSERYFERAPKPPDCHAMLVINRRWILNWELSG